MVNIQLFEHERVASSDEKWIEADVLDVVDKADLS